jgi:hypothetical protein
MIITLRNKKNPEITRPFPLKAWELADKSWPIKTDWEVVLPEGEAMVYENGKEKAAFVPPEIAGIVNHNGNGNTESKPAEQTEAKKRGRKAKIWA